MSEWQPIETAPIIEGDKGPVVLVHIASDNEEYRVAVAYHWGCWSSVDTGHDLEPTHWMPLPAPPKA